MKTNLDELFKTSEKIEEEGIWFTIKDGVGFKVRRFGGSNSSRVKLAMAKHYKPYARQIEMGTLDKGKEKEITTKVFVESCIIDWKGIEIDGKVTPFSKEVAVDFFLALPDLADTISQYASDNSNYKEDLGNS